MKRKDSYHGSLDDALAYIEKMYGQYAVSKPGEAQFQKGQVVSTGSLALDIAIGGGKRVSGIELGAITMYWGPPGSGKSTAILHAIATVQELGRKAVLCETEPKLDREYAEAIGVDVDALYIMNMVPNPEKLPLAAEDILTEIEILASTGEFGLIALDSVTGLSPRRELESELEEENPGLQARVVTKACRRLAPILKSNECGLLVADQQRANFKARGWGASPTKAAMANAIKHYAKLIVRISRGGVEKDSGTPIGIKSYGYCMKNQGGIPYHTAEFYITHGLGIDLARELIDFGQECGAVEKRGSWYYLMSIDPDTGEVSEEQIAQGQENSAKVLRENREMMDDLKQKVVERILDSD